MMIQSALNVLRNDYRPRLALAILWTFTLTVYLVLPENQAGIPQAIPPATFDAFQRELFFSGMHLLTFGITTILWCVTVYKTNLDNSLWIIAILLFGYGLGAEFIQSTIPGRSPQLWDVIANSIGIFGALYLWITFVRGVKVSSAHQTHRIAQVP